MALGVFVAVSPLVAWYLHMLLRLTPPGDFVAMQYTTALGFVAGGLAGVAHCVARRRFAFWLGVATAGLGSLSLGEHLLGLSVSVVDTLFGGPFVAPGVQRASAHAALTLALCCGVLLAARVPGGRSAVRRRLAAMLSAAVAGSGFVGLLGWVLYDSGQQGFA